MRNIAQGAGFLKLLDLVRCTAAADHFEEQGGKALGLFHGLSDDHVQHDVRGGLGDGAAVPFKRPFLNDAVLHPQLQDDIVPAGGVDPFQGHVGPGQGMLVIGILIVVDQDLVVKRISQGPFSS